MLFPHFRLARKNKVKNWIKPLTTWQRRQKIWEDRSVRNTFLCIEILFSGSQNLSAVIFFFIIIFIITTLFHNVSMIYWLTFRHGVRTRQSVCSFIDYNTNTNMPWHKNECKCQLWTFSWIFSQISAQRTKACKVPQGGFRSPHTCYSSHCCCTVEMLHTLNNNCSESYEGQYFSTTTDF